MKGKILSVIVFLLLIFVISIPVMSDYWIVSQVQKMLEVEIDAKIEPQWFQPTFELRNVSMSWEPYVKIIDGDLQVQYSWSSLVNRKSPQIEVRLQGKDLVISLKDKWAYLLQKKVSQLKVDELDAKLVLNHNGIDDIAKLHVRSELLNFQIDRSE